MAKVNTRGLIRRILLSILVLSLIAGAGGVSLFLRQRALDAATNDARLMLVTAVAVRSFTSEHVEPALDKVQPGGFTKVTVPSFAAQTVYRAVQAVYPAYTYREPALNPTNPQDRPTPFEVELINRFRADKALEELRGVRNAGDGSQFYLARPIRSQRGCLTCHSTPDRAPAALVAQYGPVNGFGWQENETIGIQMLTVPIEQELRGAVELAALIAAGMLVVFFITYWAITLALDGAVVRPLVLLTRAASEASQGGDRRIALPRAGAAEVRALAESIERLRISLAKALKRLAAHPTSSQG